MDEDEERLLAATRRFTHARDIEAVVTLLGDEMDGIVAGKRSRAFTGLAFDAYCRAFLAAYGHGDAVRQTVEALCARSRNYFGDQPWTYLYQGCLYHLDGRDSEAAAAYALAAPGAELLWPSSIGCRSVVAPEQRTAFAEASARLGPIRWERRVPAVGPVLFAACDHGYLRRFAAAYLRSIARHVGDGTVHLHIVNPAADDLTWLEAEAASLWPRLAVSTEIYGGPDQRAYFALARMLRLAEILGAYQRPVLATDIDAAFSLAIAPFQPDMHVGLRFKRQNFHAHPWNTIQAGALVVAPTMQGLSFAIALADIGAGLFAERAGAGLWFIDQNVLFSAFRQHEAAFGPAAQDLNMQLPGGLTFGKDL
jgi:hypothetical protein